MAFRDVIAYMEYVCVCSMTPVVDQENNNKPVHLSKFCLKRVNISFLPQLMEIKLKPRILIIKRK